MVDSPKPDTRELAPQVKEHGWFLPPGAEPFTAGGGGSVYRCYDLELIRRTLAFAKDSQARVGASDVDQIKSCCDVIDSLYGGLVHNSNIAVLKVPHRPDKRLAREVEAMQRCVHPNLTRILAADRSAPPAWFVMEYHPKGNLEDARRGYKGRPLEVLRRIRPVVEALAVVHEAKLIHRDIKPRNIFIARDDRWVLGDFGIVFDPGSERLTSAVDGEIWSRDWRPDWVARRSPGEYTPAVDVHMLVKSIYALILGHNPPASQVREPDCNLREAYPDVPGMDLVQAFVERHVTVREADCASSGAPELLGELDDLLRSLEGARGATPLFHWLATSTAANIGSNSNPPGLAPLVYLGRRYKRLVGRARLWRNGGTSVPQGFTLKPCGAKGAALQSSVQGISGEVPHWVGAWTEEMVLQLPPDLKPGWFELSVAANNTATLTGFVLYGI